MVYRSWKIAPQNQKESSQLQSRLHIGSLLSEVLVGRGLQDLAEEMLNGAAPLPSPLLLLDMEKAAARVAQAIENDEKIAIFGDYDVDGITATALLFSYLESVGANVYYKLPSRADDGYGLSVPVVERLAKAGVELIITVDSGISSLQEIELAAKLQMEVVVTDHHLPQSELPHAAAVVDPMRPGDPFPEKHLSGVGVAFQLVCALEGCAPEDLLEYYADLIAIGTIADLMPLTEANRTMVKTGVAQLADTHRPGLAALIEEAGLSERAVSSENVSFALAPRLNAAGRMGDATLALHLLLTDDVEEAKEMAQKLSELNAQRQQVEQEIMAAAVAQIGSDAAYAAEPVLVVCGNSLQQGVVGIVASRLVEKYAKPAIVISIDENGEGKGSGRSVPGFSLHGALCECASLLLRFGGHDQAAGLSVRKEDIPAFREAINKSARKAFNTFSQPPLAVDAPVELGALTSREVEGLSALAPYGSGNPLPLFAVQNAVIDGLWPVQEGRHTRIRLRQNGAALYAMQFGVSPEAFAYQQGDEVEAVVSLSVYKGQNGVSVSARLRDIRPAKIGDAHVESAGLYDSFCMGACLTNAQKEVLFSDRAGIGQVYKAVGKGRYFLSDLRPLFKALSPMSAGRAAVAVAALQELGLVEANVDTGRLALVPAAQKKDLASSKLLSSLKKEG